MVDLVGTCPKGLWLEWLAEGDAAGEPETGQLYEWRTRDPKVGRTRRGDRFYVVAHGRLRGWAPVIRVVSYSGGWAIVRGGSAVACTIAAKIPGFRGLRARWWPREDEVPFPEWRTP